MWAITYDSYHEMVALMFVFFFNLNFLGGHFLHEKYESTLRLYLQPSGGVNLLIIYIIDLN